MSKILYRTTVTFEKLDKKQIGLHNNKDKKSESILAPYVLDLNEIIAFEPSVEDDELDLEKTTVIFKNKQTVLINTPFDKFHEDFLKLISESKN